MVHTVGVVDRVDEVDGVEMVGDVDIVHRRSDLVHAFGSVLSTYLV